MTVSLFWRCQDSIKAEGYGLIEVKDFTFPLPGGLGKVARVNYNAIENLTATDRVVE